MKLKGLVWFFTIALIIISVWELSYTWVIRNHENRVKKKAEKYVNTIYPKASKEEKDALVKEKKRQILDSTRDEGIFPVLGTSYKKCKQNELNLGLDLQGGMSVTLEINMEYLIKQLSKNPKDPRLLAALNTASANKSKTESDYITLFSDAFISANGKGSLSALFAGNKGIKPGDNDEAIINKIRENAKEAITQTNDVLKKRIDQFGVAQPNINFDEKKGLINVELAGEEMDIERVRKQLQASANLQFWEVYKPEEVAEALQNANYSLSNFLRESTGDTTNKFENVFLKIIQPQTDKNGQVDLGNAIGSVKLSDTATFNDYINNPSFKSVLPGNIKFLFGKEEKNEKNKQRFFPVFAIKTKPGSEKAPLEGSIIEEAGVKFEGSKPMITMDMTPEASIKWAGLTRENIGRAIAITLDNVVYSAPNVNAAIEGGSSQITGNFTTEEAKDLVSILKSGKLSVPTKIVAQQIVGPTLGKEAIKGGFMAFAISFLVIFLLMLIYYNTAGWVANIALILNLLFTIGVLTALGFTLTAAGIAGLVLTIGMAVDTNVIIFERIKEELVKGKSYQLAVNDGYQRSLAPVIDAHITSLLTAVILYSFGLGPVLGFATTQIIGIVLSLFCGILVSRLITEFWTNKKRHFNYFTVVSKNVFKNAKYKFIEYRKVAYVISSIVLLAGIASFFNGFHLGVEFKGGRSYTIQFDKRTEVNDALRNDLKKSLGGDNITLKTVGDDGKHLNITTAYLKDEQNADSLVQLKLLEGLNKYLPPNTNYEKFVKSHIQSSTTVQPSISEDLKRGAVKATIFAMIFIFFYIFLRFRDWRYSAGTILTLLHDVLVTLAVFSFFKEIVPFPLEIDQHFIAAILTVIGFSMNDTVIVFDRIREYSRDMKSATKTTIINKAINDTLSRTIMTSLTVFLTILILFIFGGEVTRGFAFAMLIGVITGTYSSIFVGAPVLIDFAKNKPLGAAAEKRKKVKAPEL